MPSLFGIFFLLGIAVPTTGFAKDQADSGNRWVDSVSIEGRYVFDVMAVAVGGRKTGLRALDNLQILADGDMDKLIGWHGARARVHFLSNQGAQVNDLAGTLQGIDNIEVSQGHAKLYEAWIEQKFAGERASLLVGLSDLNTDFYQNDSAGLLIAPAFGIGSELAATGPNGPSIFPSTAMTMRLSVDIAAAGYVHAAIVNARAGVPGDAHGVDLAMRDGALLIAEAGIDGEGKISIGAWRYTRRQNDVRMLDHDGRSVTRVAAGAYVLIDQPLRQSDERSVNFFMRAGLSEGKTTPFKGGLQTGLLVRHVFSGRPESQISIGLSYARISHGSLENLRDVGIEPANAEAGIELTYQDQIASFLSIQPDLQYIRVPYSESGRRNSLIVGLRIIATFGSN